MQVNYGGTLHVLEYARATRRQEGRVRVVGGGLRRRQRAAGQRGRAEAAALAVRHRTSYASELALDYYASVHGVPTTALRFFNVYGPRQDPSSPYSGVISIFTDRARAGRPLTIFGDGSQTRDFVYVGDVVRAIIAALGDGNSRLVANVGTGGEISVLELARAIVELCGNRSTIEHAPARAGEILKSRARVDRLREQLGVVAADQARRRPARRPTRQA